MLVNLVLIESVELATTGFVSLVIPIIKEDGYVQ